MVRKERCPYLGFLALKHFSEVNDLYLKLESRYRLLTSKKWLGLKNRDMGTSLFLPNVLLTKCLTYEKVSYEMWYTLPERKTLENFPKKIKEINLKMNLDEWLAGCVMGRLSL